MRTRTRVPSNIFDYRRCKVRERESFDVTAYLLGDVNAALVSGKGDGEKAVGEKPLRAKGME